MSVGASLRPDNAATGGFLDATNAVISNIRFIDQYPNNTPSALLEVTFQPEEGKARTELYRAGKIEVMRPSADGKRLTPPEARMRRDSGAMLFISSLIDGGFDVSKVGDDITVFTGTEVFLRRKPLPAFKQADGTMSKERDVLLVEKVLKMPGEGKKAVVKAAVKPVAKAAPAPVAAAEPAPVAEEVAGDTEGELEAIVAILLAAAPDNTIARNRIGNAVFQAVVKAKNKNRAPLMALVAKDEFLGGESRPWAFDGENLIGQGA
jgi:hypothetical protein